MPKKKGKVNKLARMSDEERARYLQHRADMEEEARRRKQELIARFIKNKLEKEEKFSRTNTAKLNQSWRVVLRKNKCKEMESDMKGMMASFQFMMERKDRLLASLVQNLYESDEQHRRIFQAHAESLGQFLEIGTQRLDQLQEEYERQKNVLLDNWDKEFLEQSAGQERAEFKLQLIIFKKNEDFQEYRKENIIAMATAKNDARLEHEEDMNRLRRPTETEVERLRNSLRDLYTGFLEQHASMLAHYQVLREKDQFYQHNITRNEARIYKASEMAMALQKQWTKIDCMIRSKLEKIQKKKEQLSTRYRELKCSTKRDKATTATDLENMVHVSHAATERLEQIRDKLAKILLLSEICSKYERNDDKFISYNESTKEEAPEYENLDPTMIEECKDFKKMDNFLLKINRVQVQVLCLKAEKARLSKENTSLKTYIKRYLTDLVLNGTEQPRTALSTESKKVGFVQRNIRTRPVTCIEGALSNAVLHERRTKLEKKNNEAARIHAYPRYQCWMQAS